MGIQQETKKDALNEGGLCCGFSLRALGLVRSPDHFELVGLCHVVASGFQCLLFSFAGPLGRSTRWDDDGVVGGYRFGLSRICLIWS
jgi:hypothetical protein